MNRAQRLFSIFIASASLLALSACDQAPDDDTALDEGAVTGEAVENLAVHSEGFREDVIHMTPRVWVAVGFALANSIMIEGDDGVIIVDTTESMTAGWSRWAISRSREESQLSSPL